MPPTEDPRIFQNGESVNLPDGTFEHPAPSGPILRYRITRGEIAECLGGHNAHHSKNPEFDSVGIA